MGQALTLSRATFNAARQTQLALAQGAIVLSSAAALILAGQPLPL